MRTNILRRIGLAGLVAASVGMAATAANAGWYDRYGRYHRDWHDRGTSFSLSFGTPYYGASYYNTPSYGYYDNGYYGSSYYGSGYPYSYGYYGDYDRDDYGRNYYGYRNTCYRVNFDGYCVR